MDKDMVHLVQILLGHDSWAQEKEKECSFLSSALYSFKDCPLSPTFRLQASKINAVTNSILWCGCFFGLAWEPDHHLKQFFFF